MAGRTPARLPSTTFLCRIDEISGRTATVVDQYSIFRTVRTDVRRYGPLPRVGETWIIDRSMGVWSFLGKMDDRPTPIITGSNDNVPALVQLLKAMEQAGWIKDETTTDQIRSHHPHTHDVPSHATLAGGNPQHNHGVPVVKTEEDPPAEE